MDDLDRLAEAAAKLPSQGKASVYDLLNVHTTQQTVAEFHADSREWRGRGAGASGHDAECGAAGDEGGSTEAHPGGDDREEKEGAAGAGSAASTGAAAACGLAGEVGSQGERFTKR